MGAGTLTILYAMVKEFMVLILISLIFALPAGWIIVGKLLNQFASRIEHEHSGLCHDSSGLF